MIELPTPAAPRSVPNWRRSEAVFLVEHGSSPLIGRETRYGDRVMLSLPFRVCITVEEKLVGWRAS